MIIKDILQIGNKHITVLFVFFLKLTLLLIFLSTSDNLSKVSPYKEYFRFSYAGPSYLIQLPADYGIVFFLGVIGSYLINFLAVYVATCVVGYGFGKNSIKFTYSNILFWVLVVLSILIEISLLYLIFLKSFWH